MKAVFAAVILLAAMSIFAAESSKFDDPELFANENSNKNRYVGLMPEKVKTIAFISPGSYPGSKLHRKGIELLRRAGYKIKIMPHAFVRQKEIAQAPLKGKLSDFYAAWNDPEVDMILCIRGGMGSEDLLDHLDWNKLKPRKDLYVQGYSDATLIVCALAAKGNGHPIAGAMSGSLPGLTDDSIDAMKKIHHNRKLGPIKVQALVPGDCRGYPIGGSLLKLGRLVNKDYCPDTTGKIIFIEASKVKPDLIQKTLENLLEKKFFDNAAGVVFCQFSRCYPPEKVRKIINAFAQKLKCPVFADYPFGHVPRSYAIDFCRPVTIRNGEVTFPEVKK